MHHDDEDSAEKEELIRIDRSDRDIYANHNDLQGNEDSDEECNDSTEKDLQNVSNKNNQVVEVNQSENIEEPFTTAIQTRKSILRQQTTTKEEVDFYDDEYDEMHNEEDNTHFANQNKFGSVHYRVGRKDVDFLLDSYEDMTYARRIALFLMNFEWYHPSRKQISDSMDYDDDIVHDINSVFNFSIHKSNTFRQASLPKAWAYFEHVTLPRHVCLHTENGFRIPDVPRSWSSWKRTFMKRMRHRPQPIQRADPGEMHKHTKLYSLWTPIERMGDFGLGTGLYFTNLRALIVLTFVLGLLNIPNMLYFSSVEYAGVGKNQIPFMLRGSAICTRTTWVPCPRCDAKTSWSDNPNRIATTYAQIKTPTLHGDEFKETRKLLIFALRNECDGAKIQLARINFVTIVILVLGLVALGSYQEKWEKVFTDGKETVQDYSIVVKNPPVTASNPDEWRDYFEQTFRSKVALITIGIDNDLLVRTLVQRREVLRRLELALETDMALDVLSLAKLSSRLERERTSWGQFWAFFFPGVPELFGRLTVLTARVQGLAQQTYNVRNVFVTFEKVSTKQRILNEFAVLGNLAIYGWMKTVYKESRHLVFQDTLLKVVQPDEAATIRWQDLNASLRTRCFQLFITNLISLGGTALVAFLITIAFKINYLLGAAFVALSNLLYALFAKMITFQMESHFAEGEIQASLYFKVGLFRYVNTAIVLAIITPFTAQLEIEGLLPRVYAIFIAELILVPLTRHLDIPGHFNRHVLAPRARTQDGMNLRMSGYPIELAERVTDMTKVVFLSFWYSAVYPSGLFFCSLVLLVKFYTDKFGLMRTWKRVLPVGNRIAVFSRRYFISTAVVAFATISAYAWSGFPYDNLCQNEGRIHPDYVGNWTLTRVHSKETVQAIVFKEDSSFRYCLQNMLNMRYNSFPALPANQPEGGEWMTSDQEAITSIYGWTSVGCLVFVAFTMVWGWSDIIAELFTQRAVGREITSKRTFHQVMEQSSMSTYIPEVKSSLFPYPLIACDTDLIDDEIYNWTDSEHPHGYYDLTKDAEYLAGLNLGDGSKDCAQSSLRHVFSSFTHYRPSEGGHQNTRHHWTRDEMNGNCLHTTEFSQQHERDSIRTGNRNLRANQGTGMIYDESSAEREEVFDTTAPLHPLSISEPSRRRSLRRHGKSKQQGPTRRSSFQRLRDRASLSSVSSISSFSDNDDMEEATPFSTSEWRLNSSRTMPIRLTRPLEPRNSSRHDDSKSKIFQGQDDDERFV